MLKKILYFNLLRDGIIWWYKHCIWEQEVMVKIFLSATAVQCPLNVTQSLYAPFFISVKQLIYLKDFLASWNAIIYLSTFYKPSYTCILGFLSLTDSVAPPQ